MPAKPDPRRPSPVDVTVGRNVRMWRLAKGLSQTQLADRIGVTFQQVQKYESGGNRISTGRLAKIARVLGVRLMTLFDDATAEAETPAEALSSALIQNSSALRLAQAFAAIPRSERKLRVALVVLVEQLAARMARRPRRRRR